MNRHTVITMVAIAAIIAPFAYSIMNIHAAEQLRYKWSKPDDFAF